MILGVILFADTGVTLVTKEFVPLLDKDFGEFVSSILSAISTFAEHTLQSEVKHIELDKYHVYLAKKGEFQICIISDVEDNTIFEYANNVLDKIIRLEPDPEKINVDPTMTEKVSEIIEQTIIKRPPPISYIEEIAKQLSLLIAHLTGSIKLPVKSLQPKKFKLSILSKIALSFAEKKSFEDIVKLFLVEKFEDVLKYAPSLFDSEHGDYARILYVISGILLNSFDPDIPAPTLSELLTIASEINDEFAKSLLITEINGFVSLGSYNEKRKLLFEKRKLILEKISGDSLESLVWGILVTPIPDRAICTILLEKFKGKSKLFYALTEEMLLLLEIFFTKPRNVDYWLSKLSDVTEKYNTTRKEGSIAQYSYMHMVFFTRLWGLSLDSLTKDDGISVLNDALKLWDTQGYNAIVKKARATIRHKSVNAYFALNLVFNRLLEIWPKEKRIVQAKEKKEQLFTLLPWIRAVGETSRELVDMYYTSTAALLASTSRVLLELNEYSKDLVDIVISLAKEEMQEFWYFNNYHFAHYYVDLLDTLGNTAMILPEGYLKNNILAKVAFGIENILSKFSDNILMKLIFLPMAIRYYMLCKLDIGKQKVKQLIETYGKDASPFVQWFISIMAKNYNFEFRLA